MAVWNQLKTIMLLGSLSGLLLFVGGLFGGYTGLFIGLVIAIVMNVGSYWFSDKLVLRSYRAKEATKHDYPELYAMTEEIVKKAKLPMPKLYVIPSHNPNAFATGRNPEHAAVAVTTGIMQLLNKEELKGVIAHEVAHIANRDILISSIAATIASVIGYVASMAQWAAIFGFGSNDDGPNIIELLLLAIVTPIIATIIQLAISRSREYLADEKGAQFAGNPHGLADALAKLEASHQPMRMGSNATAHLFISNPFKRGSFSALLSTHPPSKERIKRLRDLNL